MKTKIFTLVLLSQIMVMQSSNAQMIWGLTEKGGISNQGTIFHMNPDGTGYTIDHYFQNPAGNAPQGSMIQATDGNLYGACLAGGAFGSCTIFCYVPGTDTYTDVYDFNIYDGDYPESGLVEGPGGILYGVAPYGGTYSSGVLYKYDMSTQIYTIIHHFVSGTGARPYGTPVFGSDGKLYGMTYYGGTFAGVIYSYDLSTNTYTDVHDFDGVDGAYAFGSLLPASDGKLYGMTTGGTLLPDGTDSNYDILFSFDPVGNVFNKLVDLDTLTGFNPLGSLTQAPSGILYGMTADGGLNNCGVIFSYDPSTTNYTLMHDFDSINGKNPLHDLFLANDGKLYGTTVKGGISSKGTTFSFDPATLIFTKTRDYNGSNGAYPNGSFNYFSAPTVVSENALENSFYAYPNPASSNLNIFSGKFAGENVNFSFVNAQGQTIYAWNEKNVPAQYKKEISLEELPAGIYLLEISDMTSRTVIKISKN